LEATGLVGGFPFTVSFTGAFLRGFVAGFVAGSFLAISDVEIIEEGMSGLR
jgi:fructose-specific phosphotransferase system IIC component